MDDLQVQLTMKREKPAIEGPGMFWALIILMLCLLALAVIIFGQKNPPVVDNGAGVSPTPTETRVGRVYTVYYRAGVFSPTNLRIHAGDTVKFTNEGGTSIKIITDPHPSHDNIIGFDSVGDMPSGSTFTFTFSVKGTFGYHNEKNINETGTIIVR